MARPTKGSNMQELTFTTEKSPIIRAGGRQATPIPENILAAVKESHAERAVKAVVMHADNVKAFVRMLRRAAAQLERSVKLEVSEPNAQSQVKVRFEAVDKILRPRKPKGDAAE